MADDSAFVFNVPTNVSFTNDSDDFNENVDQYFSINNENNPPNVQPDVRYSSRLDEKSMYFSPNLMYDFGECETVEMRRSMSVGNLIMFSETEDRGEEETSTVERVREDINNLHMEQGNSTDQQSHYTKGSATLPRHGLSNLQRPADNKRYQSAEKLAKSDSDKYVSFAEAVHQFQTRTPVRFRSKPNGSVESDLHNIGSLQLTYAQSPYLQTKARSRPTGNIQSTMERELTEFENIRKFKIKARPVNKKILQGPIKPQLPVEKRPHTVLQPFNITQVPAKKVVPSSPTFIFHARPAPKPKTPQDAPQPRPAIVQSLKNCNSMQRHSLVKSLQQKPLEKTVPMPFSFERRDKLVQTKRDQYIQKILDEEKRAREFYAKPVPKAIYKKSDGLRRNSASSTDSCKPCDQSSTETRCSEFRARPATVLRKEPFVPLPAGKPPTEPVPFHLESEQRRQERERFEMQKRLKEEHIARLRRKQEEKELLMQQEEALRLRKETEYKAQPIKSFKPLVIKPSGKVTVPVSPKTHKRHLD
ncbi:hypothetical protein HUJ04_003715 [Dendroctonus ponderosae]|uniref:TPX2 C-terminal domain-containing protein n=1 Tax=Dendroctonus ponderosae TaxID=77166 RepID=A0AAR5P364_DENPD|nr:hypothetical protein HUJ04_003715 [Dendroctonus ponderosae]KAH1003871.1 hypothetical protein HUJ04_003715 [Dendroctonus ponderosae]